MKTEQDTRTGAELETVEQVKTVSPYQIHNNQIEGAVADFEQAVALKHDYADAYFNLGRTYYLMHDEDKACENYKLAAQYGRPNLEDYLKRCD